MGREVMMLGFSRRLALMVGTDDGLKAIETGSIRTSRRVWDLAVDVDFVTLLGPWLLWLFHLNVTSLALLRSRSQVHGNELAAPSEHHLTHTDVDDHVHDDDDPNRTVEGSDAKVVPSV